MKYRGSITKWFFLVFGILISLVVLQDKTAAFGMLSSGLLVAFAILHAADRLARRMNAAPMPPAADR